MSRKNIDSLFFKDHGGPQPQLPRLSFTLKDISREGEQPLDVVFDKAMKVLNRIGARPGEADDAGPFPMTPFCKPNWLAKWAIRAVCEAIIAKGMMPIPLAVDMRWKEEGSGELMPCALIPDEMRVYARKQGVNARFLAEVVLNGWMAKAPEKLTLRTPYPLDDDETLDGREER